MSPRGNAARRSPRLRVGLETFRVCGAFYLPVFLPAAKIRTRRRGRLRPQNLCDRRKNPCFSVSIRGLNAALRERKGDSPHEFRELHSLCCGGADYEFAL